MTPLTLDDIAALPVGARVWWRHWTEVFTAVRVGSDAWQHKSGIEFTDSEIALDPTYLGDPPTQAPNDSAGTWEPGATAEAAAWFADAHVQIVLWAADPDPNDTLIAALNQWQADGDPRPLWEYIGMSFGDYMRRCARIPDDVDGTPDPIPTQDTDPVTEASK